MTYFEVMARSSADIWWTFWPIYFLVAAFVVGAFAKWITPK